MRHFLPATLVAVLLVGCQPTNQSRTARSHYDRQAEFYAFDFTEYTDQGFLITPESYEGSYHSVGILRIVIWPEVNRVQKEITGGRTTEYSEWISENLRVSSAIDSLHTWAEQLGADAIINFQAD